MLLRLQRAPPFPSSGPQSRLWGGSWLAPVIQRTCWPPPVVLAGLLPGASVSFVISVRAYFPLPEGQE